MSAEPPPPHEPPYPNSSEPPWYFRHYLEQDAEWKRDMQKQIQDLRQLPGRVVILASAAAVVVSVVVNLIQALVS